MAQNFDILIEGSDTSITVKMEYLFAFQFWFCELCVECRWGGGRKHCFVNFRFFGGWKVVG